MWLSAGCGELRAESNNLGGMCDELDGCWWQSMVPPTTMTATTTAAKVKDDDNNGAYKKKGSRERDSDVV